MSFQSFEYFSDHAKQRLKERTLLSTAALSKILEKKRYVVVGKESALNREHCLFYDIDKKEHFVVIRDVVFGTLITVLPINFYANLVKSISEQQLTEAKNLQVTPPKEKADKPYGPGFLPPKISIIAHLIDIEGKQKNKSIIQFESQNYKNSIDTLINDPSAVESIVSELQKLERTVKEIFAVSARIGSRGELIELSGIKF